VTFGPGCQLLSFPESLFKGCSSLRSICIPSSIETISPRCFAGCGNLGNIIIEGEDGWSAGSMGDLGSQCYGTLA
jgi:hypothetical protein